MDPQPHPLGTIRIDLNNLLFSAQTSALLNGALLPIPLDRRNGQERNLDR